MESTWVKLAAAVAGAAAVLRAAPMGIRDHRGSVIDKELAAAHPGRRRQ